MRELGWAPVKNTENMLDGIEDEVKILLCSL